MSVIADHEAHPDMPVAEPLPPKEPQTRECLKAELKEKGITMLAYAKDCGVNYMLASKLMNGSIKGRYGKAHEAAVKLGLKVAA